MQNDVLLAVVLHTEWLHGAERQGLVAAGEGAVGEGAGRGVHHEVGAAAQQLLEHDPSLEAGRGCAEAEVGAAAEREQAGDAAADVELLRVGTELAGIAVGRAIAEKDAVTRGETRSSPTTLAECLRS